jgi:tRNA A37 methylthiotransferase MiaB
MKNTLLILGAAFALSATFANEPKTQAAEMPTQLNKEQKAELAKQSTESSNETNKALSELKTQKEVLVQMREGLSEDDQKALEADFKSKLAEIDKRISQLEAIESKTDK